LVERHIPSSSRAIERICQSGEIGDGVPCRPSEGDRAEGGLGEAECVIGTAAAESEGGRAIDQQIRRVHTGDRLAERDARFREVRHRGSGRGYARGDHRPLIATDTVDRQSGEGRFTRRSRRPETEHELVACRTRDIEKVPITTAVIVGKSSHAGVRPSASRLADAEASRVVDGIRFDRQ
jgi:hypothetical protein